MRIFLQVKSLNVSMNIFKEPMKMMDKFRQVEILKAVKMILTMVDQIPRVENLKTTMLVIMIFLPVRILNVLMKIFFQLSIYKARMRMDKNFPQVGTLKAMMTIMTMLDSFSRMRNLKETMLALMISLKVRIFRVPMRIMKIFLQVRILKLVMRMRMMKNIFQVASFKVAKMITPLVVTLSRVIN
jgi:hypothetical protein